MIHPFIQRIYTKGENYTYEPFFRSSEKRTRLLRRLRKQVQGI